MIVTSQEFTPDILKRINETVVAEPTISRRSLSKRVCGWLNWRSENGKLKDMSCRKVLLRLQKEGKIQLPESEKPARLQKRVIYRAIQEVELPTVFCNLDEMGTIEIIPVQSCHSKESRIWNYLMQTHHYLGAGPLCGKQIRYLLRSSRYGWLGGLSFSAPAWHLKGRDEIIGWSITARKENLKHVVCNSRFLIVPTVQVPNLASWILSRVAKRLTEDWNGRYGYKPVLLETFVEKDRFRGTCYRAANWIYAGLTSGRGRQDRHHEKSGIQKHIYLYPLQGDWQETLCMEPEGCAEANKESPRKKPVDWAEEEFWGAELGDARLTKRLLAIARDFYARPGADIPQASGTRAKAKGAYRFLDNKQIEMKTLLNPHYEATVERIKKQSVVLAVQDTTSLNYTAHPSTQGLGPITTKKMNSVGLIVHDTMTFTEEGTPLGLLDVQCWARDTEDRDKSKRRHREPIENKESYKWLKSYHAAAKAQRCCPDTMIVSVGDRESDIHELFTEALKNDTLPKLLVRAERTRKRMTENETLWEKMRKEVIAGIQEIHVPRSGSRPARDARLEVRFSKVTLNSPKRRKDMKAVVLWAVYVCEVDYGEDVASPLEWMLLTTVEVSTFEQAIEKIMWYARRWGIEVYHRVMKSGCKIEDRQLGNTDRIENCLAIDMVVAWRIYHLTKLGRETPNLPCTVYFREDEWKALVGFKTRNPVPPEKPPCLRDAIWMVASLGGFLGRKGDGEPGTTTLWRGLQRLDDITEAWNIFAPSNLLGTPLVSSKSGYG